MSDLEIEVVDQLGRQKVHDPASKEFARGGPVNRDAWTNKLNQIFDPPTNPNQCHGECTGCANAMMLNSVNNRDPRRVLDMRYAHTVYSGASAIDPWAGSWPPTDTGSSGLAAAKIAQREGTGAEYRWIFNGADGVVQAIQEGRVVSVGTWWTEGLFRKDRNLVVEPTGRRVGGHQYVARGYELAGDYVIIRCWWGRYRDARIKRAHLNDLLLAGGDAHVQDRKLR